MYKISPSLLLLFFFLQCFINTQQSCKVGKDGNHPKWPKLKQTVQVLVPEISFAFFWLNWNEGGVDLIKERNLRGLKELHPGNSLIPHYIDLFAFFMPLSVENCCTCSSSSNNIFTVGHTELDTKVTVLTHWAFEISCVLGDGPNFSPCRDPNSLYLEKTQPSSDHINK